ncbi:hypothetical protein V6N13_086864 [Hibiscus sabdariffa]|uniref:Uncharacterized protein n=1 Tax=Hibiscus sabdariffa TaxID=183260 RepID=A0ABR2FUS4_9ROSI
MNIEGETFTWAMFLFDYICIRRLVHDLRFPVGTIWAKPKVPPPPPNISVFSCEPPFIRLDKVGDGRAEPAVVENYDGLKSECISQTSQPMRMQPCSNFLNPLDGVNEKDNQFISSFLFLSLSVRDFEQSTGPNHKTIIAQKNEAHKFCPKVVDVHGDLATDYLSKCILVWSRLHCVSLFEEANAFIGTWRNKNAQNLSLYKTTTSSHIISVTLF